MLSFAPAASTAGWLASIATAGSFCLFAENGDDGLPTLTSVSGLSATALPAGAATKAAAAATSSAREGFRMASPPTCRGEELQLDQRRHLGPDSSDDRLSKADRALPGCIRQALRNLRWCLSFHRIVFRSSHPALRQRLPRGGSAHGVPVRVPPVDVKNCSRKPGDQGASRAKRRAVGTGAVPILA
jgi:hypothetical protein